MELSKYIACICEGSAEEAIINILLDNNKLIFDRDALIENEPLRCRSGKEFEKQYLRKGFSEQITVFRILDSRRENYVLSKAYKDKIKVVNVITAPEIEMLVIINEGKYDAFKHQKKKPSDYCKIDLKMSNVKSKSFVENYFQDVDTLINAIVEYKRLANVQRGELTLADILN